MTDEDDGPTPPMGSPRIDDSEELAAHAEIHSSAWEETLDDMWALEEEFEEEGWTTIAAAVGHTGAVAPFHDKGYWGLSYVLPDSDAEAVEAAVDEGEFPQYDVYRQTVQGRVFAVVTFFDPGTETVILVATNFRLRDAADLVSHTHETGYVNSIFRYLDGRVVAEIRHDEPEKFFPRYEEFETFSDDWHKISDDGGE